MEYIYLENSNTNIKYIYHIADIHIRQYKRHEEYLQVFANLYLELSKNNLENSILVIVGDILHSKNELTPELINITTELFTNLANLLPIFIIAGNHDANINNKNRLDSLTPITNLISNTKYKHYYLKNTGLYSYNNLLLVVNSILDDTFIFHKDIDKNHYFNKTTICLWHGTVDQTLLFTGNKLHNEYIKVNSFQGYDISMLGDIHKHQFLNETNTMAYSGSLIQQNFGETLKQHGMIKWTVKTKKGKFIEILNDFGYCTLYYDPKTKTLKFIEKTKIIPKYPRFRIKLPITIEGVEKKNLIDDLKKTYKPLDIMIERLYTIDNINYKNSIENNFIDISLLEYQQTLIEKFCQTRNFLSKDILILQDINSKLYHSNTNLEFNEEWSWELLSLEFSNLFCYGENNKITFSNLNGNIGILAPNHYGKSAIIDIILFALYDKISRGKRTDILNKNKQHFQCSITLKIGNQYYRIDRNGTMNKNKNIKITVKFNKLIYKQDTIETISLNGEQRIDTQKMIESYIGTYEHCISTIISLQNKHMGMIDMKQTERKNFLSSILKLDILEQQYELAHLKYRELDTQYKLLVKEHNNTNHLNDLKNYIISQQNLLTENETLYNQYLLDKQTYLTEYESLSINPQLEIPEFENYSKLDLQQHFFDTLQQKGKLFFDITNYGHLENVLLDTINNIPNNYHQIDSITKKIEDISNIIEEKSKQMFHIPTIKLKSNNKDMSSLELAIHENKNTIKTIEVEITQYQVPKELYPNNIDLEITKVNKSLQTIYKKMILIDDSNDIINKITTYHDNITKIENTKHKSIKKMNQYLDTIDSGNNITNNTNLIRQELDHYTNYNEKYIKYTCKLNDLKDIQDKIHLNQELEIQKKQQEELLEKYQKIVDDKRLKESLLNKRQELENKNKYLELEIEKLKQLEINQEMKQSNESITTEINELKKTRTILKQELNQLQEIENQKNDITNQLTQNKLTKMELQNQYDSMLTKCNTIEDYLDNIINIRKKSVLKQTISKIETQLGIVNNTINTIKIELGIKDNELQQLQHTITILTDVEKERNYYKLYLDIMGPKNGLRNDLISKSLPMIETTVNDILRSITDYTIQINMIDNNIDIHLLYPNQNPCDVELACGYEKFITSIAIRIGILNISRKNKPTFFTIDEGWCNLDIENMANTDKLLYYLKTNFNLVFIISHIDSLKGDLDTILSIEKNDNYSYINV